MSKVIEKSKIWFSISLTVIIIGLAFMIFKGLNVGIDFKGGTLITLDMAGSDYKKADVDAIINEYAPQKFNTKVVNGGEELEIRIQDGVLDESKRSEMISKITEKYSLEDGALENSETIGGTVGSELERNATIAVLVAIAAMLVYITVRFEFAFAMSAIIALAHDVLVTLAFYAIFGVQINLAFIAAILTIVGYSINDTIVVFDRIRENRKKNRAASNTEIADISIRQTISRSINTSFTTLITIAAVYVLVPSIREISFPLIIGIISGAYSSIFIASPLWVIFKNMHDKKHNKAVA